MHLEAQFFQEAGGLRVACRDEGGDGLECRSIMMDIGGADYRRILDSHEGRLVSKGNGGLMEEIMGGVMMFETNEVGGAGNVLGKVMEPIANEDGLVMLFGEKIGDFSKWLNRELGEYEQ